MSAAQMDESKVMLRVLITQTNPDGSIQMQNIKNEDGEVIGQVERMGGVVKDRLGEVLGHVYQEEKYDRELNRKPEHYVYNWYRNPDEEE